MRSALIIASALAACAPRPAAAPDRVARDLAAVDADLAARRIELSKLPDELGDKKAVAARLAALAAIDARLRQAWLATLGAGYSPEEAGRSNRAYDRRMVAVDRADTAELKRMLSRYDWITIPEFGAAADEDAWLLAQHADTDTPFQKDVLARLSRHLADGGASRRNYAFLLDRVARREGRPQRFGTQGGCDGPRWKPDRIEDPAGVDARRASMGLEPLAAYVASQTGCGQ